jgi:uncharacterized membrane protein YkvI
MKKFIIMILVILVAGKYLLSIGYSADLVGVILGIGGGPVLIILAILWLMRPKKHKTGCDDIDQYL